MPETMVGGVVVFDYDGDGDEDVLYVDAGPLPGYSGEAPRSRLFRNDGAGRFVDTTAAARLAGPEYGAGGTAGDVDGDGDLDLFLAGFGPDRLLRNEGDGTFHDVTAAAGAGDPSWSMSAAFADLDRDGDLDLYVANYVEYRLDVHKACFDEARQLAGYCTPLRFLGAPDRLFRNRGDGTFAEATREMGLPEDAGNGLGVVVADLDEDGWPDLYVANDTTPNFLYRNRGRDAGGKHGGFEDVSTLSGAALSDRGRAEGSMGVDAGDADGDGRLDLVVTNFELETNVLYRNQGNLLFSDSRFAAGIAEPSLLSLGFGTAWADFDHDADLDFVVANGHILDNAEAMKSPTPYRQRNQVYENRGGGRFAEVKDAGLDVVRASRGLATGDLDGDGDLEVVVVNSNDWSEVYEGLAAGPWLAVDLLGGESNRSGIGARVELEAAGKRQVREVKTGSSYLSQNALTLHFGLGGAAAADRLSVRWPSGKRQRFEGLPANRRLLISE
ncbi:MAG TPA: CRTAC1 family protein [Thermoanaerobaculia bacterium]|nr:CRTAC1 family protein [Thermoanaerobaculia bacterium]